MARRDSLGRGQERTLSEADADARAHGPDTPGDDPRHPEESRQPEDPRLPASSGHPEDPRNRHDSLQRDALTGTRVHIGLGSNLDAERNLARARAALKREFGALELSAERAFPASDGGPTVYRNQVARVTTELDREALVATLKRIENELGRVREPGALVAIDLDLLTHGDGFEAEELRTAAHWRALGLP
jgi:2-amino-4-hydroxy-6-hydroxymethyldihydropteridine diphosphokinase